MSNSETSSNYEDNAIRKVDKYQIIYTARQAYKISFAFAVLELNVDKAEKHRENNSLVRSDIFSELNSRIQNILNDSDPISKYLSPSLNYLDYGMSTLTKYEWHSLRDSAHRGIKKTVRSQEEFFKYKKKDC